MTLVKKQSLRIVAVLTVLAGFAGRAPGAVISFGSSDFGLSPVFNSLNTFDFTIDIAGAIVPGGVYVNPTLNGVDYNAFGVLTDSTPSGFPAFNLMRTITGPDFYAQGSSLSFSVSAAADLTDGLQIDELVGADPGFCAVVCLTAVLRRRRS